MSDDMTQMTSLHEERLQHAIDVLKETGARRILDLAVGRECCSTACWPRSNSRKYLE